MKEIFHCLVVGLLCGGFLGCSDSEHNRDLSGVWDFDRAATIADLQAKGWKEEFVSYYTETVAGMELDFDAGLLRIHLKDRTEEGPFTIRSISGGEVSIAVGDEDKSPKLLTLIFEDQSAFWIEGTVEGQRDYRERFVKRSRENQPTTGNAVGRPPQSESRVHLGAYPWRV